MAEALRLAADPDQFNSQLPVVAYATDDVSLKVLQSIATAFGQSQEAIRRGNLETACEQSAAGISADYILLDVDDVDDPADLLHVFAGEVNATYGIVAFGSKNDIGFYRELTEAGAIDYVVKPLTKKALDSAISAAEQRVEQQRQLAAMSQAKNQAPKMPASLTVFVAARGGVGSSTIAVNSAWCVAHTLAKRTVLVDLDLQFGISALALDLDPGRGFREILSYPDRMDSLLLNSALVRESDNLAVLGAEEPVEDHFQFQSGAIDALTTELRNGFEQILIDLPRSQMPAYRSLLEGADRIVLVTDLTLAGIRDAVRILQMLDTYGKKDAVTMVASRVGPDRKAQVSKPQFEKGVKRKIDLVVPEDFKNVSASANAGRTVPAMAKTAPSAKAFQALAEMIAGENKKKKKGLLSLFNRKPESADGAAVAPLAEVQKAS